MTSLQQARAALGSTAVLQIDAGSQATSRSLLAELWQHIDDFNARFSRFLDDSELTQLNGQAGQRSKVSPEMHQILAVSRDWAAQTGGLFNPFVLPNVQRAGYKDSLVRPESAPDYTTAVMVEASSLQLGDDWAMIPAATALDLGGIGKGYLLTELHAASQAQSANGWLSLGGDLMVWGQQPNGQPWEIGVETAERPQQQRASITIPAGQAWAIATSGTTKRRGSDWHHLIDPHSGRPADTDVLTATILSPDPIAADVLASCAVILGSQAAPAWLAERDITDYLLQTTHGCILEGTMITMRENPNE